MKKVVPVVLTRHSSRILLTDHLYVVCSRRRKIADPRPFSAGLLSPIMLCANEPGDLIFEHNCGVEDMFTDTNCTKPTATCAYFQKGLFSECCPTFWKQPAVPPSSEFNTVINRFHATPDGEMHWSVMVGMYLFS